MTRPEFLDKAQSACVLYSGSISSWVRSEAHNHRVGGHPRSMHLCGLAVDVVLDNQEDADDFIAFCVRLGLMAINYDDHIHVQIK